jgi:hypothetical protein
VVLRGADGQQLAPDGSDSREGDDVVAIELRRPDGTCRHAACLVCTPCGCRTFTACAMAGQHFHACSTIKTLTLPNSSARSSYCICSCFRQFSRNEEGCWYRIMQVNKWKARLAAQQQDQRQVAAAV